MSCIVAINNVGLPSRGPVISKLAPEGTSYIAAQALTPTYISNGYSVATSPDGAYMGCCTGLTSSNAAFFWGTDDYSSGGRTSISLGSTGLGMAMSNTHIAFIIASGVFVFNLSDGSSEFSDASIGTPAAVSFSPDGAYMVVTHGTAPYIRIYDTAAWGSTDAADNGAASGAYTIVWDDDDTFTVFSQFSSPYANNLDVDGVRNYSKTSTNYRASRAALLPDGRFAIVYVAGTLRYIDPSDDSTTTLSVAGITSQTELLYDERAGLMYLLTVNTSDIKVVDVATDTELDPLPAWLGMVGAATGSRRPAALLVEPLDYNVTGTVRDVSDSPAARDILVYDRTSTRLVASTASDGSGDFSVDLPHAGPWDFIFRRDGSETLNDLIYARVTAV